MKKIFSSIDPEHIPENFLDPHIHRNYPRKDYHRMYIGEITQVLIT